MKKKIDIQNLIVLVFVNSGEGEVMFYIQYNTVISV